MLKTVTARITSVELGRKPAGLPGAAWMVDLLKQRGIKFPHKGLLAIDTELHALPPFSAFMDAATGDFVVTQEQHAGEPYDPFRPIHRG